MGIDNSGKIMQRLQSHGKEFEFNLRGDGEIVVVRIREAVSFDLCLGNRWPRW